MEKDLIGIGQRIKKRRMELGIMQQDLADMMGYSSKTTICKIENGKRDMVQSKLIKFAQVLHTTPEYLMGLVDENGNEVLNIHVDNELIDIASKLTPEQYALLIGYARLLEKS